MCCRAPNVLAAYASSPTHNAPWRRAQHRSVMLHNEAAHTTWPGYSGPGQEGGYISSGDPLGPSPVELGVGAEDEVGASDAELFIVGVVGN